MTDRERRQLMAKNYKKAETPFEPCDLTIARNIPKGMTRAFKNNRYTVMIFDNTPTTHGPASKIFV